jgi:LacI family transcriptional regulator
MFPKRTEVLIVKIKMADVARYLGISKATVSLAVNGKPGVNEQTRQRILQCIEEMEKNEGAMPEKAAPEPARAFRIIKVVIINHRKQVVCDPELDLWSEVLSTFDSEARKRGYLYGLTYLNETDGNLQDIIEECNLDMVAGVILFGTEMNAADHEIIRRICKPLVIYDYEMPDGSYSSVCIDNARAVEMGLELLKTAGASDIRYFGTGKDIYNFQKRREAFRNTLLKWEEFPKKDALVLLGNSVGEITERAAEHLSSHKVPDGIITENYQVSIGVLTALRKLGIRVPKELKLVGIDEVPEYAVPDVRLTQVKIPHVERAAVAMSLLDREIRGEWATCIRVFAVPELLPGKSV